MRAPERGGVLGALPEDLCTGTRYKVVTSTLYETHARLYILPAPGIKQVQSVTVADVRLTLAEIREQARAPPP